MLVLYSKKTFLGELEATLHLGIADFQSGMQRVLPIHFSCFQKIRHLIRIMDASIAFSNS